MVAPAAPAAAVHLLTPGSPGYAMLKVGAIGGIIALRFAFVCKNKSADRPAEPEPIEVAPPVPRDRHPVSRKKKRRRRR